MDNPVHLASLREFTLMARRTGRQSSNRLFSRYRQPPSTSIAVEELAQLGIRTFLRIGTTGAIQENINVGDVRADHGGCAPDGAKPAFRADGIPGRS